MDADLATCLLNLEARYGQKQRLARALDSATTRRQLEGLAIEENASATWPASVFARPVLDGLCGEVAALTATLLQIDETQFTAACDRWTGGGGAMRWLSELLFGSAGARAHAAREAVFLQERRTCLQEPMPQRVRALARATPGFVNDLFADARAFRRLLRDLRAHARAPLELRVYGFGEISRPVGLARRSSPFATAVEPAARVYKRLAPFARRELAAQYVRTYDEYNQRLRDDVGIIVPAFGHRTLTDGRGRIIVISTQAALDPRSIGKAILLRRDAEQCLVLFRMVLAEYRTLVRYNQAQRAAGSEIGIDGQITNWAVRDYAGDDAPLRGDEGLFYIDTNTPMMRTRGVDCLPLEFYLQALPRLLRPLLRPLARGVLDRYFNPRTILLDFLANTSIHGRPELVDRFLPEGNAFLTEGRIVPTPPPITRHEVDRYIASDVLTWRLTRSLRQVEEMLQGERGPLATVRQVHQIWTRPIF